jgi:HAD superfamily hydrolase (TIGR01509 family)
VKIRLNSIKYINSHHSDMKSGKMIKVILFDFWGTIVEQGVWSPIKQVRNILNIRMPFSEYVVRMEKAMMTKKFASLKDAFKALCEEFKVEPSEDKLDELVGLWNKNWMLAKPYVEIEALLKSLKKKYKLILVSNAEAVGVENVLEKFNLQEVFDKSFLSYNLGCIKTDPKFLQKVISELGVEVKECLLVGDSIQSDMLPAKNCGMETVLIDRKNSREYPKKIKHLKELSHFLP